VSSSIKIHREGYVPSKLPGDDEIIQMLMTFKDDTPKDGQGKRGCKGRDKNQNNQVNTSNSKTVSTIS